MTAEEARKRLISDVEAALLDKYGPPVGRIIPPGLRLEMHPAVRAVLLEGSATSWDMRHYGDVRDMFAVPVIISAQLPLGRWRLVIVTEQVLAGGDVRDAPGG